jgi:glucose-6-phosphate-specific signal transduction histidine kinase
MTIMNRARPTRLLWIAAIWCACALVDASLTVLVLQKEHPHRVWLPLFGTELISWLPWALATPFVVGLARRYQITRTTNLQTFAVHLAAFAAISIVAGTWSTELQVLVNPWSEPRRPAFVDTWMTALLEQLVTYLIAYALILAVTFLVDSRDNVARRIAEEARLNEELSRAQLGALRRQIEPHFIFNTLNSIAALVRDRRNDAAVSMIVGLSEFLRRATEDSHRSQVTLAEEVEYLERYLDIQKIRFGERLQASVLIPSELLGAQVPALLLQPLVENAVKHGIAKRAAGGTVRVDGARRNGELRLRVYNEGPGLAADWQATNTGVGIDNLRTRLRILHGDKSRLELRCAEIDGVEAIVTLPFVEL